jgi:SAM-dependent methyltransferase
MSFYQSIADSYDSVFPLNDPQVLFVRKALGQTRRVLDAGCGTGTLCLALSRLGFSCLGLDLEPAMVAAAQAKARREGVDARFEIASLASIGKNWPQPRSEAILCVGNTLVHLPEPEVSATLEGFAAHLPSEGRLIIQILNYDRILEERVTALPLIDNDQVTFTRTYGFDRLPGHLDFHTELLIKSTGQRLKNTEKLYPLRPRALEKHVEDAEFEQVQIHGGFDQSEMTTKSYACVLTCVRSARSQPFAAHEG